MRRLLQWLSRSEVLLFYRRDNDTYTLGWSRDFGSTARFGFFFFWFLVGKDDDVYDRAFQGKRNEVAYQPDVDENNRLLAR
jgi:hypothetical protein